MRHFFLFFRSLKGQKGKKAAEDSEDSDVDDLDDEEVSLGSMDEEDFGDELEDEGGTFIDPDECDNDEGWKC